MKFSHSKRQALKHVIQIKTTTLPNKCCRCLYLSPAFSSHSAHLQAICTPPHSPYRSFAVVVVVVVDVDICSFTYKYLYTFVEHTQLHV